MGSHWLAVFRIFLEEDGEDLQVFIIRMLTHRRFFIAASVLGLIGTIIGASAQSINMLIVSMLAWVEMKAN